jgi:hypothetical protein
MGLFDMSVISGFVLTRLQFILLCKISHPCDDDNASNTFWLMMTHGDGSCIVLVLVVVVVEHKFSESGTP